MKRIEQPSVALIYGGRGYEHEISVKGAEQVYPLIDGTKFGKIPVYIRKDGTWVIPLLRNIPSCPRALADDAVPTEECCPAYRGGVGGLLSDTGFIPIISAFPLLHGDFGEDGTVQGSLENAKIPYVGCDVQTSAVARDKGYVKLVAEHLGIPTAEWVYVTEENYCDNANGKNVLPSKEGNIVEHSSPTVSEAVRAAIKRAEEKICYPMFVKPARLGSSIGAGAAHDRYELEKRLLTALDVGSGRALIEELVDVECELECGCFATDCKVMFTNIGKIDYHGRFYDYEAKYFSDEVKICARADIDDTERKTIHALCRRLTDFLGLLGVSRIDFFRTRRGDIYFNEINTMPGFTETSLYPELVADLGFSKSELINRLIFDKTRA